MADHNPLDPDGERDLLNAVLSGNRGALNELLGACRGVVLGLVRLRLQRCSADQDMAEDITQNVLLKLSEGIWGFKRNAKLSTWLKTIVVNECRDYIRRVGALKRRPVKGEVRLDELSGACPADRRLGGQPLDNLMRRERAEAYQAAKARLSGPMLLVIECLYEEELNYPETADRLHRKYPDEPAKVDRVRYLERKALESMKESLDPHRNDSE